MQEVQEYTPEEDTEVDSPVEIIRPKGKWGGRREGGGRPSGSRSFTTIMREAMINEIQSRTYDVTTDLFRAQLTLALGYSELWKIEKELVTGPKGGQKYVAKRPERVENSHEIEEYLCGLVDEANGDLDDEKSPDAVYYYIVKVPPSNAALQALQERTLGKVAQQVGIGNPDGTNLGESSKALTDLTQKLNEIHGATSLGSNGVVASTLDSEAPDKNV